jgi:hypothetical protein
LTAGDIRELLRREAVRFVVADVGARPDWIPETRCFEFWKDKVRPRVADARAHHAMNEFPADFFYFASEWLAAAGPPIVVLERQH